ncbi:MAG: tetratricopeptide repeat protein [Acidobacteriota bacterium]
MNFNLTLIRFLPLLLLAGPALCQAPSQPQALLPPRVGLVPVPLPELETLEEAVGTQIAELQDSLRERLSRPEPLPLGELAEAYGILGQLYQAYEFNSSAEAAYLNAVRLAPREFRWVYLQGTLLQKTGRLAEALLYLQNAHQLQADYLAVPVHVGNIYLQMNRVDEARAQFEQALKLDSNSAAAHYGLGEAALAAQRYEDARQHFEAALQHAPGANRIHYSLAMAYRGLGDLDKARTHLQQRGTVGVRPADPLTDSLANLLQGERVYQLRGRLAYQAGRMHEAAQAFQKAVEAAPDSAGARVNLGSALAGLGETDAAIEQFRKAVQLDPANRSAHYNLGSLIKGKGDSSQALQHFLSALEANPEDREANFQAADLLALQGRFEEALPYAAKAYSLDRTVEESAIQLARIQVRLELYPEAFSTLDVAYGLNPRRGQTAHALARLLAASPDASIRNGEHALKLARQVFNIRKTVNYGRTLAYALAELGRCDEAAQVQSQLVEKLEQSGDPQAASTYRVDLERYKRGRPCRPADGEGRTPPDTQ